MFTKYGQLTERGQQELTNFKSNIANISHLTSEQIDFLEKVASINHLDILEPLSQNCSPTVKPNLYVQYLELMHRLIGQENNTQLRENLSLHFPTGRSTFYSQEVELFIAFASKYPEGLRNVRNDAIKSLMIDRLGIDHFIKCDVTLLAVMPEKYKLEAQQNGNVENYLSNKTHTIITPPGLHGELKKAYDAYSEEKYPNQCVRVSSYHFEVVKKVLTISDSVNKDNEKQPTLVFMGPTLGDSKKIADCSPSQIAECVKAHIHKKVSGVVLMGYNTAGVTASVEDTKGLLGQVASAFREENIKGVNISAFKGEGYSYAKSPQLLFAPQQTHDMEQVSSEIKYTS
ncbi:Uncharacterised protein [Legionella busanensis]|uniref:Uncharacterized protein n=1 Tax=Legionella busanensis TaxID=190655 RepID=A0A378JRY6_9GAMM|nr:hypothetical protein [Legionella busanensis]STX50902.1 Uncharacterised protein [Legionella busanensis]